MRGFTLIVLLAAHKRQVLFTLNVRETVGEGISTNESNLDVRFKRPGPARRALASIVDHLALNAVSYWWIRTAKERATTLYKGMCHGVSRTFLEPSLGPS